MIILKNLHFAYGKKQVFDNLNLELHAGHIYGLLGSNGMGKSTLLRTLTGLLLPQGGSILVNGHVPGRRTPAFLQQLFFLPEAFLLPDISITQYVNSSAPFYPAFHRQQFDSYLAEFEVPGQSRLQKLSYGQQKKLLISFGLACNTPLLLMDEPTNGLDMASKRAFRKLIAGAVDENKCIVISTHQVKDLENLLDHLLVLNNNQLVFAHPLSLIQDRLSFKVTNNPTEVQQAVYAEQNIAGYEVVLPEHLGNNAGIVDLELLHKAIVANAATINQVLTHHSTTSNIIE